MGSFRVRAELPAGSPRPAGRGRRSAPSCSGGLVQLDGAGETRRGQTVTARRAEQEHRSVPPNWTGNTGRARPIPTRSLPEPHDSGDDGGGRSELIASLIFLATAVGAVAWDRFVGFVQIDGTPVPLLSPEP
ncbi:hypothetical protein GCM10027060_17470 [Nesterenkonia halophila]